VAQAARASSTATSTTQDAMLNDVMASRYAELDRSVSTKVMRLAGALARTTRSLGQTPRRMGLVDAELRV
jgi:hypothetical protein